MEKLYFLNEEEKNRILRIHEDATKRQYLLREDANEDTFKKWAGILFTINDGKVKEEVREESKYRRAFSDDVRRKCLSNSYGGPTFSSEELNKKINYFYESFSKTKRSLFYWESALGQIKDKIRGLDNMGNFCAVNKGFSEKGGYSSSYPNTDLLFGMSMFIYNNSSWDNNIKAALDELISGTGYRKIKSTQTDSDKKTETSKDDTKSTGNEYKGKGGSGSGWISINSKYDKQILKALGKTGDKLTDDDIKNIYNKLKSAGKIK